MKYPLIIANWKLNGNEKILKKKLNVLSKKFNNLEKINIIISPPTLYLGILKKFLVKSKISLCSQNVDINEEGSFTGEISAKMLKDIGIKYSIIGHSERRKFHKENYDYISKKFKILVKNEIIPILCIGETLKEYKNKKSIEVCIKQISCVINNVGINLFKNAIISYEPIWAIGTGYSADEEHVQMIHSNIRKKISKYNKNISKKIFIQYGGSVNVNNVKNLILKKDIDGFLIGKSSLEVKEFLSIIKLIKNIN